jgi:1-deoxy-D-xylulose-5-phosphate reductoisomerase
LDLAALSSLNFEAPDVERFPCISLAYRALNAGGTLPAAMNAANEEAVQAFIDERIMFSDIARVIEQVMEQHRATDVNDLNAVLLADRDARIAAKAAISELSSPARVVA